MLFSSVLGFQYRWHLYFSSFPTFWSILSQILNSVDNWTDFAHIRKISFWNPKEPCDFKLNFGWFRIDVAGSRLLQMDCGYIQFCSWWLHRKVEDCGRVDPGKQSWDQWGKTHGLWEAQERNDGVGLRKRTSHSVATQSDFALFSLAKTISTVP